MNESLESDIPSYISHDSRVQVGRFTYGSPRIRLWSENERISIGSFCSIADGVTIFGGGEHNTNWVTTFPLRYAFGDALAGQDGHPSSKGPTIIGHDVWLGDGATILSGVEIGNGAVIGAGAVVASDVPPYRIVVGNPARVIKMRFTEEQIQLLERIAWWDWPIATIREQMELLCGGDVDAFIHAGGLISGIQC